MSVNGDNGTYAPSLAEQEEYAANLARASAREESVPAQPRTQDGKTIVWWPQEGSQTRFMQAPFFETLYHGTRGPGKTDALLMSYAQHVGIGYGESWRGIIFRETYPQLGDIEAKSRKWFRLIFGHTARFNRSKMMWEWNTGEALLLRHMKRPEDYWNYHGHEYPFEGWEEITNWSDPRCYTQMFACCRSSTPGIPRMVRATTNPYGVGHNWVKDRFDLHGDWTKMVVQEAPLDPDGRTEPSRCAIHGHISENKILLSADPNYRQTIVAAASNPAMAQAWEEGSWDIVAGGMFDDVWDKKVHIVDPFPIPKHWRLDRSFDWGSAVPFSVGWWAESDGSDVETPHGWRSTVKGDLFRISEWYGWSGHANVGLRMLATQISSGIVEREMKLGIYGRVKPGPADSSIFDDENGVSIARDMARPVRIKGRELSGVVWRPADKGPGSVQQGLEQIRNRLEASKMNGTPRELPGLFVFRECSQFVRTLPPAPRDEKKMDEIADGWEDHVIDETRYRLRFKKRVARRGLTTGT